jgi:hypothetical protein
MKKVFLWLTLLVLAGCYQTSRSPLHHVHGENIFARELYTSGYIEFSKVYYHMSTSRLGNLEEFEPINKGKLGTTQGWRKEERFKQYY